MECLVYDVIDFTEANTLTSPDPVGEETSKGHLSIFISEDHSG